MGRAGSCDGTEINTEGHDFRLLEIHAKQLSWYVYILFVTLSVDCMQLLFVLCLFALLVMPPNLKSFERHIWFRLVRACVPIFVPYVTFEPAELES